MKHEQVRLGMKVLIPTQKSVGYFGIQQFLIALDASNPLNQDHLYIIHNHKPYFREQKISYTLGFSSSSSTNDSVNGYKIGEFEFLAEDLVAYPNPDDLPSHHFVAGQDVEESGLNELPIEEGVILIDGLLDNKEVNIIVNNQPIAEDVERLVDYRENSQAVNDIEEITFNGKPNLSSAIQKEGLRYNEGKLDYTLMDMTAFSGMIDVLDFGMKKYSRDNWKSGGSNFTLLKILGSMMRHIALLLNGQLTDEESRLSHISHIQCNAMFLGYFWNNHLKTKKSKQKSNFLKDLPNGKRTK